MTHTQTHTRKKTDKLIYARSQLKTMSSNQVALTGLISSALKKQKAFLTSPSTTFRKNLAWERM